MSSQESGEKNLTGPAVATRYRARLRFSLLDGDFAVCRLASDASLPDLCAAAGFFSITRTADELSIVCPQKLVPAAVRVEGGWKCFKLEGPIPFSATGILVSFVQPLADRAIPVFAVSTYDTDYVLVKQGWEKAALQALLEAGHQLIPGSVASETVNGRTATNPKT
jgi:hypothetical protein